MALKQPNLPILKTDEGRVILVKKANDLVEARYRFDIWEMRVFTRMIAMIRPEDADFFEYKIYLKDMIGEFGLDKSNSSYDALRQGARKLMQKIITVFAQTPDGRMRFETPIVAGVGSFEEGSARYITVSFHPNMKPFLLQLKSQFLMYDVRNILKLPSTNSIRIYELLKQYERIGWRRFAVSELKDILGMAEKYALYGHFKERVISKAQADLAAHTDIQFEFEEIKRGKMVHEIIFRIHRNESSTVVPASGRAAKKQLKPEAPPVEISAEKEAALVAALPKMKGWGSEEQARKWLAAHEAAHFLTAVDLVARRLNGGEKIQNPAGYLAELLKQTTLTDPKAAEQKKVQKRADEDAEKMSLAAEIKALRTAIQKRSTAIAEQILAQNPEAEHLASDRVRASTLFGSYFDPTVSMAENRRNKLFGAAFHNELRSLFPEHFEPLRADEARVEAMQRRWRNL